MHASLYLHLFGRIHMCDMTRSYVWRASFLCATWLVHTCDIARSCVWHDSFVTVTWLVRMSDMTHSYVWHDPFRCMTPILFSVLTYQKVLICVTKIVHTCDALFRIYVMTHSEVCHPSSSPFPPTGWLRLVGSWNLSVSFAKYCLFYRAFLRNRPMILRSLLIVAIPYQGVATMIRLPQLMIMRVTMMRVTQLMIMGVTIIRLPQLTIMRVTIIRLPPYQGATMIRLPQLMIMRVTMMRVTIMRVTIIRLPQLTMMRVTIMRVTMIRLPPYQGVTMIRLPQGGNNDQTSSISRPRLPKSENWQQLWVGYD